jgi:cell division protein FtsI/penicillin-binding protein 2
VIPDTLTPALIGSIAVAVGAAQVIGLAIISAWAASRKEKRDAERKTAERKEDYDRQDAVARKAEEAARLLVTTQQAAITRTNEVARLAAEADHRTHEQLTKLGEDTQKIHTLVNSDMTAARTAERSALKLLVIAIRKSNKLTPGEAEEITRVEKRIEELDQILADRLAAQTKVDAETAQNAGQHPTP